MRAGTVVRMPRAYPVYDADYEAHLGVLRGWLDRLENLYTVGRNGQHRYNNQDHSMLTGLLAARGVAGERQDVWSVNVEDAFLEERREVRDRLTPAPARREVEEMLREAFALYDEVAMGGAVGLAASLGLAVATSAMLLEPAREFVPVLSLLGNYLFGYRVSWSGLAVGMVESGLLGFALGWTGARLSNVLIRASERDLERRLATLTTLEGVDVPGGRLER